MFVEAQRAAGATDEAITRQVEEGYASGRFIAPRKPGIVYMMSAHNYVFDPERRQIITSGSLDVLRAVCHREGRRQRTGRTVPCGAGDCARVDDCCAGRWIRSQVAGAYMPTRSRRRLDRPHWLKTLTRLAFEVPISRPRSASRFCV
jgi:hypothetical protein